MTRIAGSIRVPGDKSVTHRALLLAAIARGTSEIRLPLVAGDTRTTARVLRRLGVRVGPLGRGSHVRVHGGAWQPPDRPLPCGNSGTTARLTLGLLAGLGVRATLTGDRSLRRRPMNRITDPLTAMGASFEALNGRLPVTVVGRATRGIDWDSPVASAQVKTAVLFAGLAGGLPVSVTEPWRSRDHTERLLRHLGIAVAIDDRRVAINGAVPPAGFALEVPGDASSAAFPIAAALLADAGELRVRGVGVNETRTGFLDVIERMGARVERRHPRMAGAEPVADLVVRPTALRAVEVAADEVPRLVDEVPALAILAARAEGESRFREVAELRVKESNRLELIARNLRALGVEAAAQGDDLVVQGTDRAPVGRVDTAGDHRLAMAFAALGTVRGAAVDLSERRSPEISYPGFWAMLEEIQA